MATTPDAPASVKAPAGRVGVGGMGVAGAAPGCNGASVDAIMPGGRGVSVGRGVPVGKGVTVGKSAMTLPRLVAEGAMVCSGSAVGVSASSRRVGDGSAPPPTQPATGSGNSMPNVGSRKIAPIASPSTSRISNTSQHPRRERRAGFHCKRSTPQWRQKRVPIGLGRPQLRQGLVSAGLTGGSTVFGGDGLGGGGGMANDRPQRPQNCAFGPLVASQ